MKAGVRTVTKDLSRGARKGRIESLSKKSPGDRASTVRQGRCLEAKDALALNVVRPGQPAYTSGVLEHASIRQH
jgi:hypothetical protein